MSEDQNVAAVGVNPFNPFLRHHDEEEEREGWVDWFSRQVRNFILRMFLYVVGAFAVLSFIWHGGKFFCILIYVLMSRLFKKFVDGVGLQDMVDDLAKDVIVEPKTGFQRLLDRFKAVGEIGCGLCADNPEILIGLAAVIIIVFFSYNGNWFRRTVFALRGLDYGEAMVPGSDFVQGQPPNCQGTVHQVTLFGSRFMGCCVRIDDVLVVQQHITRQINGLPLIKGPAGQIILAQKGVPSEIWPDYVYYKLDMPQWGVLGIRAAAVAQVGSLACRAIATINSQGKSSSATLVKGTRIGLVYYEGSTEEGFSGAGYFDPTKQLLGVHYGVSDGHNCGFAASIMLAEILKLFRPAHSQEAKKKKDEYANAEDRDKGQRLFRPVVSAWFEQDVIDKIGQGAGPSWAYDQDIDYNEQLDFGESTEQLSGILSKLSEFDAHTLGVISEFAANQGKLKSMAGFKGQCKEGEQANDSAVPPSTEDLFYQCVKASVEAQVRLQLEQFTAKLPEMVEKMVPTCVDSYLANKPRCAAALDEGVAGSSKRSESPVLEVKTAAHLCDECKSGFATPLALAMHKVAKHVVANQSKDAGEVRTSGKFVPEAKKPANNFLGQRNWRSSSQRWAPSYSTVAGSSQYSQLVKTQERMIDILSRLENSLGKLAQGTHGQKEEELQN